MSDAVKLCYGVCVGGVQELSLGEGGHAVLPTFAGIHGQSAIACAAMLKSADPDGEPVQVLAWTDDGEDWIVRDSLGVAEALDTCRAVAHVLRRDVEAHMVSAQRRAAQDDPRGEADR